MKFRKFFIVLLIPIVVLGIYDITKLTNPILYLINGSTLKVNGYIVNFPFPYWAYFKENGHSYVIAGSRVGNKNLKAEILKEPQTINIEMLKKSCKEYVKNFSHIKGKQYICLLEGKGMMYFVSDDGKLVLNTGDNFDPENENETAEYNRLLNNIASEKSGASRSQAP